jgi:hypothetical protein
MSALVALSIAVILAVVAWAVLRNPDPLISVQAVRDWLRRKEREQAEEDAQLDFLAHWKEIDDEQGK